MTPLSTGRDAYHSTLRFRERNRHLEHRRPPTWRASRGIGASVELHARNLPLPDADDQAGFDRQGGLRVGLDLALRAERDAGWEQADLPVEGKAA